MTRPVALVAWIFATVGLVLLGIGGGFAWRTQRFLDSAVRADGVVVELASTGRSYAPVVEFTNADGQPLRFRSGLSRNPPGYDVGEHVVVLYPPQAPERARIDTWFELWFVAMLLAGLGAIFGGIGGVMLAVQRRAARIAAELRRTGRRIEAELDHVEEDWSVRVNNRPAKRLVVRSIDLDSGSVQTFRSGRIWLRELPPLPSQFTVFVDPRDETRYLVDVGFLHAAG
jgi:hypothetical protein